GQVEEGVRMAMMLKCPCGRSVVLQSWPASGRVPCPICSREILVPSASDTARVGSRNAQSPTVPPPLPVRPKTTASPPPLPVLSTPVSPAPVSARMSIAPVDPARESPGGLFIPTILGALSLALIVGLGGYAVLGDWSGGTV